MSASRVWLRFAPTITRTRKARALTMVLRVLVLKQVHPDTGISNKAMAILNSFVNDIFERIATEASSTCPFPSIRGSDTEIVWQSSRRTLRSRQSRHARFRLPSASSFLVSLRSTPSQKAPSPSPRFVLHYLHRPYAFMTRHAAVLERRSQVSAFALLGPRWRVYVGDVEVVLVARGR